MFTHYLKVMRVERIMSTGFKDEEFYLRLTPMFEKELGEGGVMLNFLPLLYLRFFSY